MEHHADKPHNLADILLDCGYTDRTFDPNLMTAIDKLAEQYGPLGVALAAAARTEPDTLSRHIAAMFAHQRDLWSWLLCDRYQAEQGTRGTGGLGTWYVVDTTAEPGDRVVATVSLGDADDAAQALASHLNHKIMLARVAQATADTSDAGRGE
jgi:hypothetical protein